MRHSSERESGEGATGGLGLRSRRPRPARVPITIEKALCRAAGDPAFRSQLAENPERALERVGFELGSSERAIFASLSAEQKVRNKDVRF